MNTSQWITIFQLLALVAGIKELWAAKEYYKQQKKKWASAAIGIFNVFGIARRWAVCLR